MFLSVCNVSIGGSIITILGENFGYLGLAVRIGTQACSAVNFIDTFSLTCTVPAGTGSPASVVVIYGQRFSRAVNSLSYAAATVDTISGRYHHHMHHPSIHTHGCLYHIILVDVCYMFL